MTTNNIDVLLSAADSMAPSESLLTSEKVLSRTVTWEAIRTTNIISARDLELIRRYDKQPLESKLDMLRQNAEYGELFVKILSNVTKEETLQYVLALIEEFLFADEHLAKILLDLSKNDKNLPYESFLKFLSEERDWYQTSKGGKILALLYVKGNVDEQKVKQMMRILIRQMSPRSVTSLSSALDALQILLRCDQFRFYFMDEDGLNCLVSLLKAGTQSIQQLYQTIYALWMLSYNAKVAASFNETIVIHRLVEIVKGNPKEKVLRVALHTLRNCLDKETNNEQMIESGLFKAIEKLQLNRWGDEDIVADLEVLNNSLQKNLVILNSFSVYKTELLRGSLDWTPVHTSEKFWRENYQNFEENKYRPLLSLIEMIKDQENSDPTTLAVACHDLGEFVRFHPSGRQIVKQLGAKVEVMKLLDHKDDEVMKHALLCLQKMMVQNWDLL